eukprot:2780597-Pleurochrysis_carterae.AAC.1
MSLHHFLTKRCHTTCCVRTNRVVLPVAAFATRRNCISNGICSRDVRRQAHWQHEHHQRHLGTPDGTGESWREARGVEQCQTLERRGASQGAGGARRSGWERQRKALGESWRRVPSGERAWSEWRATARSKGVQRQHA